MVSEATRRVMQANKSKNTKPELKVRAALREAGLSGYRLHWKKAPGKPDICYPGRKVAIFVNGCFWHRCPYCALPDPKSTAAFWEAKFARNRARDRKDRELLVAAGWTVIVVWECRLKKGRFAHSMEAIVHEVRRAQEVRDHARALRRGAAQTAAPLTGPDFAWTLEGRVVEIGSMPVWRRGQFAERLRMRHSGMSKSGRARGARTHGAGRRK